MAVFILVQLLQGSDESELEQTSQLSIKPALTVEWLNAYQKSWQLNTRADGRIMAWHEAKISTQTSGLMISHVLVNVGDLVKKGQVLAEFENEKVKLDLAQLTANVQEAEANYHEALLNYDRGTHLQKTKSISDREFNELKALMLSMKSRLESAKAAQNNGELRFKQTQLLAPDDGVISERQASVGIVANAGDELFKMIVQNRLEWQAEVAAYHLSSLAIGQEVLVTLINHQQVRGVVRQISPTIDPMKNTAVVYVDLETDTFARAGMYVKGEFLGKIETFLTLPQSAVSMSDGFYYVFKIRDDSFVQQIKVTIGARQNDQIAILTGVSPQDKLVASGVSFLKEGDIVNIVGQLPIGGKR
ncbi:efflux RND transporter periplasmic adaptor subunit [Zophobihabitans entericus]|uniref:Efflux RND transporter periplasmic adaptor subunit n=1 Tax=Zophobihabitans entericus TaxID=1635327 RepID=A0A6G9I9Z9_9GAMM|nr:efflux RND transporter periplasmic adaptor subunit [Zophobihabitans entericus]QIQ20554.1 efflux RND transporter periplasmic adaptor subunit [Zophobihabitans entericus]